MLLRHRLSHPDIVCLNSWWGSRMDRVVACCRTGVNNVRQNNAVGHWFHARRLCGADPMIISTSASSSAHMSIPSAEGIAMSLRFVLLISWSFPALLLGWILY